ncbi:MAG: PD-(D/E)XK nuclease family protein, partial [Patescibacteria group bacterium]
FLVCLSKQPLTKKDFEDSKKKGKDVLEAFWESEREHWHTRSLADFNVAGVTIDLPTGEKLLLRGRLDKMDLLTESPKNSKQQPVCVVDFKTGRPKTRNQILGETASATGNEKRQLDFYRLLLDLYDDGKYMMTNGTILFTEPDEKGRIKKETFDITAEDSEKVKAETIRVAEEILNFEFWDEECGDKDCSSCKLRKILIN